MSLLNRHASELVGVVHGILHCLRASGQPLGAAYAETLEPMIEALDEAVFESCDRERVAGLMTEIDTVMNNVNRSAVVGGFEILTSGSDLLGHYWELNTIFRESRYRDQPLTYDRASGFRSRD